MLFPFVWQPATYRHALEICAKVDTPGFSNASCSSTADASFVSLVGCQADIANRQERLCDEDIATMQIKRWKQGHLQFPTSCRVIKISAVRSNETLCSEAIHTFPAQ